MIKYLKYRLFDKNEKETREFFEYLSDLEFKIPKNIVDKLGEKFCKYYMRDTDDEFIFLDKNAKHFMIDFEKIRNKEKDFLKQPKLFPFYIPEVKVIVTNDAKLVFDNKEITLQEFDKLYDKYKQSLISIIKKKDKIFKKIELDLEKRFFKSLKEVESKKITDYEIDVAVEVFDILLGYEEILTIFYTGLTFKDKEPYSLSIFGLDLKVSRICWYLLNNLGLKAIENKFNFWSEIEIKNQKFFML